MVATARPLVLRPPVTVRAWNGYCTSLQRAPLVTKAATSLVGFALGDLVAQLSSRSSSRQPWRYDVCRTARLAAYGGLLAGPIGHYWFNFLDQAVYPLTPRSPLAIGSKILLDQALMGPLGTALFFSTTKLLDGHPEAVPRTLKTKLAPTLLASYKLWPAAHVINFACVPASQRILYTNIISVLWTTILSKTASQDTVTENAGASLPQQVARHLPTGEICALVSCSFSAPLETVQPARARSLAFP